MQAIAGLSPSLDCVSDFNVRLFKQAGFDLLGLWTSKFFATLALDALRSATRTHHMLTINFKSCNSPFPRALLAHMTEIRHFAFYLPVFTDR